MNSRKINVREVLKKAITIRGETQIYHELSRKVEKFVPQNSKEFEKTFEYNGSTITFINKGTQYVVPYVSRVVKILQTKGFKRKYMYMPFSSFSYPIEQRREWYELRKLALL